jgi:hypothetical protein
MKDYGVFAQIVAIAGSLASAVAAITLAFMRRARWQPPEEALPAVAARFAALLSMVILALLYVFGLRIGLIPVACSAVGFFVIAVICLLTAITTNITFSFHYPDDGQESSRKLGGNVLTAESIRIQQDHPGRTEQELFVDAHGSKDIVWTKRSQASVNSKSTMSFIGLIGFRTCSLAAAAMLVAMSMGSGSH